MYDDLTLEELETHFSQEELEEFYEWYNGQTRYNHDSYNFRHLAMTAYLTGAASLKAQNN